MYGCSASSFTLFQVGAMTKNVRNRASPTSTCGGGTCCVPSAWRRKWSTTMIRVNAVVRIRIAGASERIVIRKRICSVTETSSGFVALPTSTESFGSGSAFVLRHAGAGDHTAPGAGRPASPALSCRSPPSAVLAHSRTRDPQSPAGRWQANALTPEVVPRPELPPQPTPAAATSVRHGSPMPPVRDSSVQQCASPAPSSPEPQGPVHDPHHDTDRLG